MGRVGRFQVMAVLQAARARALGLSPDEAASFGLNRAIFYAVAKSGFRRGGSTRPASTTSGATAGAGERKLRAKRGRPGEELVKVGGEDAYAVRDRRGELRFAFGDEVQQPEDFDREIGRRFDDWDAAWSEAQAIIAAADPEALRNRNRFFEEVYKPHRDTLAAQWSGTPATPRASRARRPTAEGGPR